jgi:hypothetical protein
VALPGALWAATRSAEAERARRLRLLLVWLGVMFVLVAITREQRMRYYLPLCPPAALLIAAWYATWRSRRRAWGFTAVWILVVLVGLAIDSAARVRFNAATDLRDAGRYLATATRVYAVDAPELVFSFYLERPVTILSTYQAFAARPQPGHADHLIIAERATPTPLCAPVRRVATATVHRRRFAILDGGHPQPEAARVPQC